MGWTFTWVSSFESDFNFDYHVSFTPEELAAKRATTISSSRIPAARSARRVSVFAKAPDGRVFHTSPPTRAASALIADYQYLDLVPKGRDEGGRGPFWVRRHDEST